MITVSCMLCFFNLQDELLDILIDICKSSEDDQICLLAGKICLYYAETAKVCKERKFILNNNLSAL